jgi:hypothetical protein
MVTIDSLCYHYLLRRSEYNSSNLALLRVVSICLGPSDVVVINGKLITQVLIAHQFAKTFRGRVI